MVEKGSAGHRIQVQSCRTHCDSEQKFVSRISYHAVFGFLIPLLITVLQLFSQGTNKYSFETHEANFWTFLLATLVYCFAVAAGIKYQFDNQSYVQLSSLVAVISGSLSSISLISIFLPHLIGVLIFIVWALVSIVALRSLIISVCFWIYQMMMKTFFQIVGIWNRFKGNGPVEVLRVPV